MLYLFASHMINEPYLFQNEMSAVKTLLFSVGAARELILLSLFRRLICAMSPVRPTLVKDFFGGMLVSLRMCMNF